MVALAKRVKRLTELMTIRIGPGAAVLPQYVTRIHMQFALQALGGHKGPRKFWREMLPRLKYYNPAIRMSVSRPNPVGGPGIMTIYIKKNSEEAKEIIKNGEELSKKDAHRRNKNDVFISLYKRANKASNYDAIRRLKQEMEDITSDKSAEAPSTENTSDDQTLKGGRDSKALASKDPKIAAVSAKPTTEAISLVPLSRDSDGNMQPHVKPDATVEAPKASYDEGVVEINIRGKTETEIWNEVVARIKVVELNPTPGEKKFADGIEKDAEARRTLEAGNEEQKKWLRSFKEEQAKLRKIEQEQRLVAEA
ncbi:hypothetical protein BT63DRAFT_461250 [Microthyrium microscopicum]|uniref:Ribosomal protein/NADH dehydrogenase domain-containing protein n=1 Tax=Microthyrium microscopicum TaxID=703497 RepID=A0A6A6TX33_9PEZI|nr:hypothetical protein BT63DRAFT_461250 [Microthyrium microscopicum]